MHMQFSNLTLIEDICLYVGQGDFFQVSKQYMCKTVYVMYSSCFNNLMLSLKKHILITLYNYSLSLKLSASFK